jgi:GNAT superfamily N-acetyltransferase
MDVRRGTTDDIGELIRLRQVMIDSVRGPSADHRWRRACAAVLAEELSDGSMAAFVVDRPGGGLAACGVGMVAQRLPSPGCEDGRYGYIQSMCTDARHRREGMARRIFEALMGWYEDAGITRVDLHASSMGESLYRALGFTDPAEPELRWRAAGPPTDC